MTRKRARRLRWLSLHGIRRPTTAAELRAMTPGEIESLFVSEWARVLRHLGAL